MHNIRALSAAAMMRSAVVLVGLALLPAPALAQYIGGAPPPLPAAPRPGEVQTPAGALARAVRMLARSPRDFASLINAGRAALDLGDTQAAIGFFGRAEEVRPSDPEPKIGMGAATCANGDAGGALRWFFEAQRLGATSAALGADRGLAQDLLGDQAAAQVDYRAALGGREADEARRRLALSLGISGDRNGAFTTLQPLLMRRDPAAQRIRAFVLALVGDERGASSAIDQAMPGSGSRMAGFFRLLPTLTAPQKAAAVHLGVFPGPNEIRVASVSPRILATPTTGRGARSGPVPSPPAPTVAEATPRIAAPDPVQRAASSIPEVEHPDAFPPAAAAVANPSEIRGAAISPEIIAAPVGDSRESRPSLPAPITGDPIRLPLATAIANPSPEPTVKRMPGDVVVNPVPPAATGRFNLKRFLPRFRQKAPTANPTPSPPAAATRAMTAPQSGVATVTAAPVAIVPSVAPDLLSIDPPGEPVAAAVTADVPTTGDSPPTELTLVSTEAEAVPTALPDAAPVVPVSADRLSGIDRLLAQADELPVPPAPRPRFEEPVKLATVDAAKTKKAAAAKKAAEEEEARESIGLAGTNWVQLAGGSRADRMGSEFRRLATKSAALKKRGGAVTAGKDYFRLLTGPFATRDEAQAFVNQLAKDGVDGFSWTRTPAALRIEKIAPK